MEQNPILSAARQEEASLAAILTELDSSYRAELSTLEKRYLEKRKPTFTKLEAVKGVIAAYGGSAAPALSAAMTKMPVFLSKKSQAEYLAVQVLGDGIGRKTGDLLTAMKAMDPRLDVTEQHLSVILSKNKEKFSSDRTKGWSLVGNTPVDGGASTGPKT